MKDGLLALAVGAGLRHAGDDARQRHCAERAQERTRSRPLALRHGSEAGSVTLGGRRVGGSPASGAQRQQGDEVAVPAYELFASTELLEPWPCSA